MLIFVENLRPFTALQFDRRDFILELACRLCCRKALLRSLGPAVLRLARYLAGFDKVLGVPTGMFAGKGVVEAVTQHAVVHLRVAHPIAPSPVGDKVRSHVHVLHAAGDCAVEHAEHDLLRGGGDGLRAGAADPVDGHRRDIDGNSTIYG